MGIRDGTSSERRGRQSESRAHAATRPYPARGDGEEPQVRAISLHLRICKPSLSITPMARLTCVSPNSSPISPKFHPNKLDKIQDLAAESPFDFIDFWAVDFAWACDKPFTHHWQDYRTSRDRTLLTESRARHEYAEPGEYFACVRVVDVFGCDTDITVRVEVPHGSITR